MEPRSETRVIGVGLVAAASAFGGLYAALHASRFVMSGSGSFVLDVAWLGLTFAGAPALSVYLVVRTVAVLLRGEESALVGAVGASLGGAIALAGSFVLNGVFLFVGWYLFPWAFSYAAIVLHSLLRPTSIRARGIVLHVLVATAIYVPWIALTLYSAFDFTAEAAGFREGSGWMENFPSAIVLSILYVVLLIAMVGAIRSPDVSRGSGQPRPSDRNATR